jgi:hypothetical protein
MMVPTRDDFPNWTEGETLKSEGRAQSDTK